MRVNEKASVAWGLNIYTSLCGAHALISRSYMFISESREGQWTWSVSRCCNEGQLRCWSRSLFDLKSVLVLFEMWQPFIVLGHCAATLTLSTHCLFEARHLLPVLGNLPPASKWSRHLFKGGVSLFKHGACRPFVRKAVDTNHECTARFSWLTNELSSLTDT